MIEINSKIINSIDIMISDATLGLQYYGEFCQFINFKETCDITTCGVNISIDGMNFLYNPYFIDILSQGEMNYIMCHEIFHLLWDHQSRIKRGGYQHDMSNVAQDMIINQIINVDIVVKLDFYNKKNNKKIKFAEIPTDKTTNKIWVLLVPKEYKGELIFEDLYNWLVSEKEKYDNWKKNPNSEKCPISDYLKDIFDQMENGISEFLDEHLKDEISEDYKKSILDDIKNNLKQRGLLTGDIEKTLNKLRKSKRDYIKDIKLNINELFGFSKQKSITKKNRRSIPGIKGKRKQSHSLCVILDTSGSMIYYFEKSLSYIFQNDIIIDLIQIDTEVKKHTKIKRKKDIQKMNILGLKGTKLTPAINYVINDNKLNKLNLLILTDGMTDLLDFKGFKNKCLILSINHKCPTTNINKNKIKQIILKD